jgi:hypothetical protein
VDVIHVFLSQEIIEGLHSGWGDSTTQDDVLECGMLAWGEISQIGRYAVAEDVAA